MLNFGGWQIELDVLEMVPESLARHHFVLPLTHLEGRLTLLTTDRGEETLVSITTLQFFLNKEIVCQFADAETVQRAIDGFYYLAATLVTRCQTRIVNPCARRWLELTETSNLEERNCGDCNRTVYLCRTDDDAAHHAELGSCVALQIAGTGFESMDMGLIQFAEFQDLARSFDDSPEMRKLSDQSDMGRNWPD